MERLNLAIGIVGSALLAALAAARALEHWAPPRALSPQAQNAHRVHGGLDTALGPILDSGRGK